MPFSISEIPPVRTGAAKFRGAASSARFIPDKDPDATLAMHAEKRADTPVEKAFAAAVLPAYQIARLPEVLRKISFGSDQLFSTIMETYDLVVIGGGSAGYAAARTGVEHGLHTAVVDGASVLGGLCILRGCMPSKALIESADRNLTVRRANEFGIEVGPGRVDAKALFRRKRMLIDDFAGYRQGQLEAGDFTLIRGSASFVGEESLEIRPIDAGSSPFTIGARSTVIATGSSIFIPDLPGLETSGFLTSDDVLDLDKIPASVTVLGGGAIALEMAHYLDGVGSRVTVVQRSPHVLSGMDQDVADVVASSFADRGITVHTGTRLTGVQREEKENGGVEVSFETTSDGRTHTIRSEAVLVALGRIPASSGLGLETIGVETEGSQVLVDCFQATSRPMIFAAGDVSSSVPVVHTAIEQGEAAATNAAVLLGKLPAERRRRTDDRLKLFGVFTHPQAASVGLSEAEARAAGIPFHVASYPFDDHGKSMVMGETEGFVKLIADRESGELIGGAAVGPEAVELIHEIVVAMHFRSTASDLARVPHYHPTLSEIWTYPAEDLAEQKTL